MRRVVIIFLCTILNYLLSYLVVLQKEQQRFAVHWDLPNTERVHYHNGLNDQEHNDLRSKIKVNKIVNTNKTSNLEGGWNISVLDWLIDDMAGSLAKDRLNKLWASSEEIMSATYERKTPTPLWWKVMNAIIHTSVTGIRRQSVRWTSFHHFNYVFRLVKNR